MEKKTPQGTRFLAEINGKVFVEVLMAYLILMQLPRLELAMGSGKLLLWSTAAALAVNLLFLQLGMRRYEKVMFLK